MVKNLFWRYFQSAAEMKHWEASSRGGVSLGPDCVSVAWGSRNNVIHCRKDGTWAAPSRLPGDVRRVLSWASSTATSSCSALRSYAIGTMGVGSELCMGEGVRILPRTWSLCPAGILTLSLSTRHWEMKRNMRPNPVLQEENSGHRCRRSNVPGGCGFTLEDRSIDWCLQGHRRLLEEGLLT